MLNTGCSGELAAQRITLCNMSTAQLPNSAPYTLRQIECFVAVAESGTMSAAAAALHASDSAVAEAVTGA